MDDEAPSFRIGRGASWVQVSFVQTELLTLIAELDAVVAANPVIGAA